ncbi:MAG TPA: hypothetical protein PKE39_11580 [Ignavibacteria bacterium]|nr:hypothetical protein [Ignavibacteria bacterium]HMQ99655.1 hypothetical protein [Ignavibacteria bacterium]
MSKNVEKTDPMFDGHLEKNILQMTPTERMDYLLMLIDLRVLANSAKIVNKEKIKKENE